MIKNNEDIYYNLTYPQKSIVLTEQFYDNSHISVITSWVEIKEEVDFSILSDAINKVIENHDACRIAFKKDGSNITQYIKEYSYVHFDKININSMEEIENYARDIPFTVSSENLVKYSLFEEPNHHGGFTFSSHHSVCDAWTTTLMLEDILKCYYLLLNKQDISTLRRSSYIGFIEAEQKYLSSEKYNKDKAYWDDIFSTPIETAPLKKVDNIFDTAALRKTFDVPEFIKEYCKNEKISPFSLFFAGISIYFSRLLDIKEVTIGTPILNRTNFAEKNTYGMFISTLPFRQKIDDNISISEFIQNISITQMGLLRHQKYPYSELQESYAQKFGRTNNLYDILFSYQNARTKNNDFDIGYETKWIFTGHQAETLAINVHDIDNFGNLKIDYDYLISTFSEEDISDMHYRIMSILEQIVSNSDMQIKDIDIITNDEKAKLITTFNKTDSNYANNTTISKLFEESVSKYPDNIALIYDDKTLTYSELNKKVNSLANILKEKGIKNNDIVGLMFYRSFEMIISQLAVLKLGAAYLPIDPAYPEERILYMIDNSECGFILKAKDIPFEIKNVNTLNVDENNLNSNTNFKNESTSNDLAYIIYTSGSTGKPKGVMIKNSNIINTLLWRKNLYNFDENITVLQIPSFSFDSSVEDIFTPLISGSKLILLKQNNTSFNLPMIKEIIELYKPNNMLVVPSFYNVLLNELSDKLKGFKHIIVAGEGFSNELVKKHFELLPNVSLYNEYGPTENSVCSTYYKFDGKDHTVYIGKPISNCKCYILNENLKPQPFDVKGELYVSGPGVSDGYIGRDDLNKIRFIRNPFDSRYPMYKTGDIAKINKDGNMTFCERVDYQVKYNGYRINLGEIETTISNYVKIPNVVAIIKHNSSNSILATYIETNQNININDLKRELKRFLPHYMIPKEIVLLEKFPSTPNGKIDRKALENYTLSINETKKIIAPRNTLDKEIFEIWKHVLKQDNISIDDNIFDIGGDSLSIISIQSMLFKKNIKVRSQDLFENPTIESISDKISMHTENKESESKIFERLYKDDINDIKKLTSTPNNVLLTGATGFLGAHILAELLNRYSDTNIYCIIRSKPNKSKDERLKEILNYYFGNKYDLLIDKRIFAIEGDLARDNLGIDITTYRILQTKIDVIINCASLVKHFGIYDLFYNSNVLSVKNLIDFAKESNSVLNHISTTSVSGNFLVKNDISYDYTENDFFIGQNYEDNVYVKTKFEAEALIFEEQKNGLNANIFRVGNIMPRIKDGKFQINKMDNAYYKRIVGFMNLNYLPDNLENQELEFTPVDSCAEAIVKLLPYNNKVFHLLNNNTINISKLIDVARMQNFKIEFISREKFSEYIHNLKDDFLLNSFITDLDEKKQLDYDTKIIIHNNITNRYLQLLDFKWPTITNEYLTNFLNI